MRACGRWGSTMLGRIELLRDLACLAWVGVGDDGLSMPLLKQFPLQAIWLALGKRLEPLCILMSNEAGKFNHAL